MAVKETLSHLRAKKANVFHSAPDALARWWNARSGARIEDMRCGAAGEVRVATECAEGVTLRIPSPGRGHGVRVTVDGRARRLIPGKALAEGYLMLPLESGEHTASISVTKPRP